NNGEYELTGENESFWQRLLPGETIHANLDDRVYAFTVITAPALLQTKIYHKWQYYDPKTARWVTKDRIAYDMYGGRDEGYRGFTYTTYLVPGRWRVIVETARGQAVGEIPFTVVPREE